MPSLSGIQEEDEEEEEESLGDMQLVPCTLILIVHQCVDINRSGRMQAD